jgi:IS30 family transposase
MSGSRVNDRERGRIVDAYKRGLPMTQVAKIVGRTPQTVKRQLEVANQPVRRPRTDIDPDEVVRLYEKELLSLRQIARRLGVSYGTVHRIVADKATMRPPGGDSRGEHRELLEGDPEEEDHPAAAAGAA